MHSPETSLDAYLVQLANITPIDIPHLTVDGQLDPGNGTRIDGTIVHALAIRSATLANAVSTIAPEIMWYGKVRAQAYRVWQIREREHTIWKARQMLELLSPEGKADGWKKPSLEAAKNLYRIEPEYLTQRRAIEAAEEAYNVCDLIVQALHAKKAMLQVDVFRARDQSLQRSTF